MKVLLTLRAWGHHAELDEYDLLLRFYDLFFRMTLLLLLAGAVGIVWGGALLLRGGLLAGAAAVLLAGCCFGSYFFSLPVRPIPLTADRLLLAVLAVQYLFWWRFGWTLHKPLTRTDWLALGFVGILTFSTLSHDWRSENAMPLARLLFYYMMPLTLYWIVRQTVQTERSTLLLLGSMAAFGVYLALTGIAETHNQPGLVFPSYIMNSVQTEFLGRARGPFLNPSACGIFQAACLGAAWMFWPRLARGGTVALLATTGLIAFGIYCTYTRSAWLGGACCLLVAVGLQLPRGWRLPLVSTLALAGVVTAATQWEHLLAFQRDKGMTSRETLESAQLRPILARLAWNMFLEHPLFGFGLGQYRAHNVDYLNDRETELPLTKARPYVQHNVWLSLLTETGLVGVTAFTALGFFWVRGAWRLWRNGDAPWWARQQALLFLALAAAYLPNAMFQDVSIVAMVNMLMFFQAGIVEGLRFQFAVDESGEPEIVRFRPTLLQS